MFLIGKRIRRNRRNFYISICSASIIFVMGLLYILIPAIYGFEKMEVINTNSLFVCSMLVFATMGFGEFILLGDSGNTDTIYQSISCAVCGILNLLLSELCTANTRLVISVSVYLILYSLIKCYYIEALRDKKNALQYIELILLVPYATVGLTLIFTLSGGSVIKTISLGFLMILYSVLRCVGVSFRTMLNSKRFTKKKLF